MMERYLALGAREVLIAALLSYVLLQGVLLVTRLVKKARATGFWLEPKNMSEVYEKCCELFPIEHLTFQGRQFRRGMKVRIVTMQQKTIEGELVGLNEVNLVCIKTSNQIIAQRLEKIEQIRHVGQ